LRTTLIAVLALCAFGARAQEQEQDPAAGNAGNTSVQGNTNTRSNVQDEARQTRSACPRSKPPRRAESAQVAGPQRPSARVTQPKVPPLDGSDTAKNPATPQDDTTRPGDAVAHPPAPNPIDDVPEHHAAPSNTGPAT